MADRRPLERGLARFLLEERGLFVVGEAATMADVLLQTQQLRPDLLVLHERLVLDHDPTVTAQIRRTSPRTKIVLLAAATEDLPPELVLLADTVVTDGPGLTELGAAVAGPLPEGAGHSDVPKVQTGSVAPGTGDRSRRWADRLQGMAVAAVIALAFLFARTAVLNPSPGSAHLSAAFDQLDELQQALPSASPATIAELATVLIDERARAAELGADTTELDRAVYRYLLAVWPSLSPETRSILLGLLGPVLPPDATPTLPPPVPTTVVPSPEPSPEAVVSPEAGPSPAELPPPVESPSPPAESPTPTTESPTPTTESPSPTTDSPSPTTVDPSPTTESPSPTTESPSPTTESPSPTTETPSPTTESPSPTTESPSPTTESPSPTTESPSSATDSTSPTESPSSTTDPASPTESPSPPGLASGAETRDGILLIPPAVVLLLLTGAGVARRQAVRKDDEPDDRGP